MLLPKLHRYISKTVKTTTICSVKGNMNKDCESKKASTIRCLARTLLKVQFCPTLNETNLRVCQFVNDSMKEIDFYT